MDDPGRCSRSQAANWPPGSESGCGMNQEQILKIVRDVVDERCDCNYDGVCKWHEVYDEICFRVTGHWPKGEERR